MITGIGVTFMITGLLAYTVVDNFNPECKPWKYKLINGIITVGATLAIVGYIV
jgi:hypothetical protein